MTRQLLAAGCGRLFCAARRSRLPRICRRDGADASTANWSPSSASCTTSCASIIATVAAGLIDREGIGKAKIQILEALLRLRQAACHPGLIDKTRYRQGSAKLDALLRSLPR